MIRASLSPPKHAFFWVRFLASPQNVWEIMAVKIKKGMPLFFQDTWKICNRACVNVYKKWGFLEPDVQMKRMLHTEGYLRGGGKSLT